MPRRVKSRVVAQRYLTRDDLEGASDRPGPRPRTYPEFGFGTDFDGDQRYVAGPRDFASELTLAATWPALAAVTVPSTSAICTHQ